MKYNSEGGYIIPLPGTLDRKIPFIGDLHHNVGVVVEAILKNGPKTYGKIVVLDTDYLTWTECFEAVEKLLPSTDMRIVVCAVERDQFIKLWGKLGIPMADLASIDELCDWKALAGKRFLGLDELGIKEGELLGFHASLLKLTDKLLTLVSQLRTLGV